jgi:hypothetical protein
MQNRYTGDIGDFAKYGLLRALGAGKKLGVAWYLYPDESHNADGKHIAYLDTPGKWRHLDPLLFDCLQSIICSKHREVKQIEASVILGDAHYSSVSLAFEGRHKERATQRGKWFETVLSDLSGCDVVFADPDNGLCEDRKYKQASKSYWKRIPVSEALVLASGRTAIIYHHNTRRAGGHAKEIQYWLSMLNTKAMALYWRHLSNRTFFIIHPTKEITRQIKAFVENWSPYFELHTQPTRMKNVGKSCPECGHLFSGKGWGGIDAHWKSRHEGIMPYPEAWPLIRKGEKPSDFTNSVS